jgi:hypothetical protein
MNQYTIGFYKTSSGRRPVFEYVKDKNKEDQGKISRKYNLLEQKGPFLSMPHAKRLTKYIYELRPEGVRLLYYWHGKEAVFTHAVDKKDFRQSDITIADNRRKESESK